LGVLDEFLGEGDVFVDVGAYVGFLSMYASWRVGERGKVLAFEPNPLAYRVLLNLEAGRNTVTFPCTITGLRARPHSWIRVRVERDFA